MYLREFIIKSLEEDVGPGDYSSLSCIDHDKEGKAQLIIKEEGVLAGVELAELIFKEVEPQIFFDKKISDGALVKKGDVAFIVNGKVLTLLKAERLVLNCMQRMSGIATTTHKYANAIKHTKAKVLDTRKTTPLNRLIEKWGVRLGGGVNHRFGLYDMIMIKDNHVDFAGGIKQAIETANRYKRQNNLNIDIEIETRSLEEVKSVLATGNVKRIMLDNFSPALIKEAVALISGKFEIEASGGITIDNIKEYAEAGVDFISVGALTHSVKSLDLSLKALSKT
ncbi:MAG TPA: carboxylating nicotinate-nucleotide diphosphorylase [Bacteroidia bacterium]|nr:carboxylating nicotinate-nucleotide diphosphorylase [Bacteroidia bacterium]HNU33589.1 carboxylating nicotinate-nucleotide diphosphorylase [Bacteroidia bacterium]